MDEALFAAEDDVEEPVPVDVHDDGRRLGIGERGVHLRPPRQRHPVVVEPVQEPVGRRDEYLQLAVAGDVAQSRRGREKRAVVDRGVPQRRAGVTHRLERAREYITKDFEVAVAVDIPDRRTAREVVEKRLGKSRQLTPVRLEHVE